MASKPQQGMIRGADGLVPRSTQGRDRGATLIIALVIMISMALVVAAVATYATTSIAGVKNYRVKRDQRYGGDAGVKAAINWAAQKYNVGRDPLNGLNDPKCVVHLAVPVNGVNRNVKASCLADAGSKSGQPSDVGLTPPEALTLLSTRTGEPGPYNAPTCTGWFDGIAGFFTGNNPGAQDASKGIIPERGAFFKPRSGVGGFLGSGCNTPRNRTFGSFKANGDVNAASSVRVENGNLTSVGGVIRARDNLQCIGVNPQCQPITTRNGKTGVETYLNGTAGDTDPGRSTPASPAANPVGNIAAPWLPVGFNSDGTPSATLPTRTTAYTWTSSTGALTPVGTCPASSATVVFLPGWYRDAEVLNKYTTSPNCKDVTFWFAPDPGPDGQLLTADDKTGGFYLDFRNTSLARGCGRDASGASSTTRWCIGGSSDQNARIVVGTPNGWSPQGVYTPAAGGGPDPRARTAVSIDFANTVDTDLSQRWNSTVSGESVQQETQAIDGKKAKYEANICIGFLGWCFSSDRAIRVRNLTPKVQGPPIDEGAAAPRGRIYLTVAYGVQNSANAAPAQAVIEAVSPSSGRKSCGTYTLFGNTEGGTSAKTAAEYNGSGAIPSYRFTDAQAKRLADTCGSVDLINGLEVRLTVGGNTLNNAGGKTNWYLDGVKLNYDTFPGANFPNPVGSGSGSADVAAKSDCDPTKAGGQLIFGGESHVYVADGSVEVCAGPFPSGSGDSPENHQSIGIWAMPSVSEIGPTGSLSKGGDTQSLGNTGAIYAIDKNPVFINYSYPSCFFACLNSKDAWVDVGMNGYTPPIGYRIQRITARVGYHSRSSGCLGPFGCPFSANPSLQTACGDASFPKINSTYDTSQVADFSTKVVMYDAAVGRNCINVGANGSALPVGGVRWHARSSGCLGFSCSYQDWLDGIEYQVTLAPTGANDTKLLPQTGCILSHPNYNDGADQPDCALIRADTADYNDNFHLPFGTAEGKWTGRFSIKGTIYAPSSPVEVDDTDYAYPLATRGAVLRTLRVTGFGARTNYDGPAIDNQVNRNPQAREATFTACIEKAGGTLNTPNEPCAAGDQILTRARVRFNIDGTWPVEQQRARIPQIIWWSDDR